MAAKDCAAGYSICSPPGATSTNTPKINTPEFRNLFVNIIQSSLPSSERVNDASFPAVSSASSSASASLCCNALLSCLLMHTTNIPFCYDKFTTNYFLPDGSYGTVASGAYTSPSGDIANLETGEYTLSDETKGNIYPSESDKPNTATLPIPSQFTGTGIGSAVPASSLGREVIVTYTTTLPGITRLGSTIEPETTYSLVQETILLPTLVSGSTIAATSISTLTVPVTIPGTTVSGVTVAGQVTTITATGAASSSPSSVAKKNRAAVLVPKYWTLAIFGVLLV